MISEKLILAFALTFLAGISTSIGGLGVFFSKRFNPVFLGGSLGFSAGVMIFVSFIEIFPKAILMFSDGFGTKTGFLFSFLSFFAGVFIIALIDRLVPDSVNPHEIRKIEGEKLSRIGMLAAIAIAIHNFPEGFATFISALNDIKIGLAIVIALAIHNIPEGISVAVPIYYATKSRKKAFWLTLLSGLSEPAGALIGYLFFMNFLNKFTNGFIYSIVAGIMVFISFDELLPTAEEYGEHHITILGLIFGMFIMGLSLYFFK